ncbi:MAG: ABC transporter ATP-binding protein, partial [Bacillales bacterium]
MIKFENIVKKYGDKTVIDDFSLEIQPGELVVFIGPSGCGKTTTLRCIAGLEQPDQGEIIVNDKVVFSDKQRINLPPEKRDLSMVFQSYAIWPHMTVFENVAYGLRFKKNLSAAEIREKTEAALELVGLKHLISRYATDLSGGQQQRVAVARS